MKIDLNFRLPDKLNYVKTLLNKLSGVHATES